MKKKVLFVVHQLTIGGAQKSLLSTLQYFDYERYDVDLYIRENKLDLINDIPECVNLIVNKNTRKYSHSFFSILFELLSRIIKDHKQAFHNLIVDYIVNRKTEYEKRQFFSDKTYDIAISYVNGYTAKFVIDAVNAKKRFLFYLGSSDPLPKVHKEYLYKYNKIVCDSNGTKEFLVEKYPDLKNELTIIHNYVDYKRVRDLAEKSKIDIESGEVKLCSCGRFSPEKGFDLAIKTAVLLRDKGISFKWIFVGDGPDREKLENTVIDNNLGDFIVFTGMQSNPYPYIKACDIYVQPSYEESFGLTITEAMILCKPVVSTETVGGKEQIINGKNGLLSKISEKDLYESISLLIDDTGLFNMIKQNLKEVDYSNGLDYFKQQWQHLLES